METDEANKSLVPQFKELIEEIKPKKDIEVQFKRERLEREVQAELDKAMPDLPFDLKEELEKGASDYEDDDEKELE